MRKYVLAAAAALSLVGTAGWANVQGAAKPSHTGPNSRVVTRTTNPVWIWPIDKEARSPVWTEARSRPAHVGGSRKSAMLERSSELGGL
jgi:type IV pilus biogenesis protein CpaD/CtpE